MAPSPHRGLEQAFWDRRFVLRAGYGESTVGADDRAITGGQELSATVERPPSSQEADTGTGTGPKDPSLRGFLGYFLRLGTFRFGGPIALAGYMQRDLVEDRRWSCYSS